MPKFQRKPQKLAIPVELAGKCQKKPAEVLKASE